MQSHFYSCFNTNTKKHQFWNENKQNNRLLLHNRFVLQLLFTSATRDNWSYIPCCWCNTKQNIWTLETRHLFLWVGVRWMHIDVWFGIFFSARYKYGRSLLSCALLEWWTSWLPEQWQGVYRLLYYCEVRDIQQRCLFQSAQGKAHMQPESCRRIYNVLQFWTYLCFSTISYITTILPVFF